VVTKQERAARQRARVEELRRKEAALQRRRLTFIIGGAVLALAAIVVIAFTGFGSHDSGRPTPKPTPAAAAQIVPAAPSGDKTTTQAAVTPMKDQSGIPGLLAWDTEGWPGNGAFHPGALQHDHVTGPIDYSIVPPVGGPHNAVWMNAGVYTKPVPTERAVHNLEHGAVWITYDPDLAKSDVAALTAFVTKQKMITETEQNAAGATVTNANRYVDLTPWVTNDLPSKIVISAWGHQLRVASPTDPRLQRFVDTFRHNSTYTPEFGAPVDGVPVQTGGRPALDGSRRANPSGAVAGG
jgi:hypothetical protein